MDNAISNDPELERKGCAAAAEYAQIHWAKLQRLVNGDDAPVDVGDLRKHTRYAAGYNAMSPTVRDLWAVVGEMGRDDRALFLKFVTSCSRPPTTTATACFSSMSSSRS